MVPFFGTNFFEPTLPIMYSATAVRLSQILYFVIQLDLQNKYASQI